VEELQTNHTSHHTAQAMLLAAMSRLNDYLQLHQPKVTNTSRPASRPLSEMATEHAVHESYRSALTYIQMNLSERLTLDSICNQAHLSPAQLNRLFHQFSGVSVMHYVRTQRINAAKAILQFQSESIKEIALLTGFSSASLFCTAFL